MKRLFQRLSEQGTIGGLALPNRIVRTGIGMSICNPDGSVNQRQIDYYREQAAGGAGLVMVGAVSVDILPTHPGRCYLCIHEDAFIPGLNWLAETIQARGARAGIQLEHRGVVLRVSRDGVDMGDDSELALFTDPNLFSEAEIGRIIATYAQGAGRAKQSGFDLIEVYASGDHILADFFSPNSNHRSDRYGGSLENRARLLLEIMGAIRDTVGSSYPVVFRLAGKNYEPGGFEVADTIYLARQLEKLGVSALHITGGSHEQLCYNTSPTCYPQGLHREQIAAIKKSVSVPVIANGSIATPALAEEILAGGQADFIALGRYLWADPHWPRKALENRPEEIRTCIRCNCCIDRAFLNHCAISCALNPVLGQESSLLRLEPAYASGVKVAVVGGGPAGLEAARIAALRGFEVTLFEAEELGGAVKEAAEPSFKRDLRLFLDSLIRSVERLPVKLVHERADAAMLKGYAHLILATGSVPSIPPIPGLGSVDHCTARELLAGRRMKGHLLVIGGGLVGVESALYLLGKANPEIATLTILETAPDILVGSGLVDSIAYRRILEQAPIRVIVGASAISLERDAAVLSTGERIRCNGVVLATGSLPENTLSRQLKSFGIPYALIGDCLKPGQIYDAVHQGYRCAFFLR